MIILHKLDVLFIYIFTYQIFPIELKQANMLMEII